MQSTKSIPSRSQAAIMTLTFGAICLAFGFSLGLALGHPMTTLRIVSLSCGAFAVVMMAVACTVFNLRAQ